MWRDFLNEFQQNGPQAIPNIEKFCRENDSFTLSPEIFEVPLIQYLLNAIQNEPSLQSDSLRVLSVILGHEDAISEFVVNSGFLSICRKTIENPNLTFSALNCFINIAASCDYRAAVYHILPISYVLPMLSNNMLNLRVMVLLSGYAKLSSIRPEDMGTLFGAFFDIAKSRISLNHTSYALWGIHYKENSSFIETVIHPEFFDFLSSMKDSCPRPVSLILADIATQGIGLQFINMDMLNQWLADPSLESASIQLIRALLKNHLADN